jgi:hypothetical protein
MGGCLPITILCVGLLGTAGLALSAATGIEPEPVITATAVPGAVQLNVVDESAHGGDTSAEKTRRQPKPTTERDDKIAQDAAAADTEENVDAYSPRRSARSNKPGLGLTETAKDRFECVPGDLCDPAAPVTEIIPGTPAVRVSDLVSFTPDAPTQQMQPNGWMVKGLPTNFVAAASAHQQTGDLLGRPADVRFTPVGYAWDYGDGTTGASDSGGATWQRLKAAEFSDTATSHTYETTGEYTITPSVIYAAEYRYAGSAWLPVQGTITIPGTPTTATAWIVRSALVADNCIEDPAGVGCR